MLRTATAVGSRLASSLPRHTSHGLQRRWQALSSSAKAASVPEAARVVVVGGGIIGCSIAYHLAKAGCKDVVLLERDALTSGTTWHAAGLMVTFGSMSETATEIRKYSKKLYSELEAETGQATGFMPIGFIELATDADRLEEYRRVAAFNRYCGVDVEEISPQRVKELFPLCRVDDVLAGFYVADDGRVNPVDVTMALAKGARMHGATICEGVSVTDVLKSPDTRRVTGVVTSAGTIAADVVVNCTGMWARQLGDAAGVAIPNQAAEHYYICTDELPEVDPAWPVIEDPSSHTYIRPERGGLLIGLFEPEAAAWNVGRIPDDFSFAEIPPDMERMAGFVERAMSRVPDSINVGMRQFFCGPESFTPDLAPLIGEAPELAGYFVAAGLNSIGIISGGGLGRIMAHWIMHGRPDVDVTGMHINRLHAYHGTPAYRAERVVESLGMVYRPHYPTYAMQSARGVKHSPLHQRLVQANAYFKEASGWEAPDWYAPHGQQPVVESYSWGRAPWFPFWAAEHAACRNDVALIDMSFMSKFRVQGRDAGKMLNRLSTANVDADAETIVYTQWLNQGGTLEADLTVTKHDAETFTVVATDTMHRHVEAWMKRNVGEDEHVAITDVTGAMAQINLQGPRSRDLLAAVTSVDVSNDTFPFRAARTIDIGYAPVLCTRITYVGELGYELFVPAEHAVHVYDRIRAVGDRFGMRHAGLRALGSLRLEKAYRDYGHDLDNTDTLLEAGLGFTADFDKPGGFIGRDAVLAQRERVGKLINLPQRVVQVLVQDPQPLMYHGEVLWRDGVRVGDVRAASYGHTLGGAVGLAIVRNPGGGPIGKQFLQSGTWEAEIAGARYPCTVSAQPMYDPKNERIRA